MSAFGHNRTHALQQTSARAFPAVSFVYLSVECPFNKFYGINCRPKLGTKLLNRFFHRRRQVSPPVNNLTHRFFDGSQHFLCRNFTVRSRHSVSPLPAENPLSMAGPYRTPAATASLTNRFPKLREGRASFRCDSGLSRSATFQCGVPMYGNSFRMSVWGLRPVGGHWFFVRKAMR